MGDTYRIYYTGKGKEFEGSPDGGKTWQTYTACKVMDYGGESYVWPPAGASWEWKKLCTKHPRLFMDNDPSKPMLEKNRTIAVVTGPGPADSFLDLDAYETKAAHRSADWIDLVHEEEYRRKLTPAQLRMRAEELLREAAAKEGTAVEEKPKRGRPRASA